MAIDSMHDLIINIIIFLFICLTSCRLFITILFGTSLRTGSQLATVYRSVTFALNPASRTSIS